MKKLNRWIAIIVVAIGAMAQPLHAGPITGAIGFGGNVTFDTSSAGTATAATGWLQTAVYSTSGSTFGDFVTPTAPAAFDNSQTLNFNTTTPITNLWSAGGFTFELLGSQVFAQAGTPGINGYVVVVGSGIITGNGFAPTAAEWSFTAQDPKSGINPNQWTFSASCNVPLTLQTKTMTNAIVLSWFPGFQLQSASAINGPYTTILGATSPYTNFYSASPRFFRLSDQ